jgi:hypothetical protein
MVDPRADLMGPRVGFRTELPHLAGRGGNQTAAAEEQHSFCLAKTTALTTNWHLPHLTVATNLMDRRTKYYS